MEAEQPTDPQAPTGPSPPKFSRYRSVRKAATKVKEPPPPLPPPNPEIKRSMSRYRKGRPSNAPATAPPIPTSHPAMPDRPRTAKNTRNGSTAQENGAAPRTRPARSATMPKRSQTAPVGAVEAMIRSPEEASAPRRERKNTHKTNPESADPQALFENDAQREAYAILNGETERQKKLRHVQHERERARRQAREEEEQARMKEIEEQERAKRDEEERLRQEAIEREQAKTAEKEAARARRQAEKEEKRQASVKQASLKSPRRPRTPPVTQAGDYREVSSPDEPEETPKSRKKVPFLSRPENGPPLPKIVDEKPPQISLGFDAPISAVNAGTRKVLVKYNQSSTEVEVTPESTSTDLVRAAAADMEERIDPLASILAESFKQVGLERPLRRYERIRDVMNSWDSDEQNTFLILPTHMAEGAALEAKDAPAEQPDEISVHIHYSNKPGSWDKRWITLRSDGQVLLSKQPGAEQKNICHMTDFDIYIPTSKRLKKIRPPKKYCFAIKSLQKSAMFLSTDNFVHFISTKDKDQASTWYRAVQSWRSWYLVHEMGLGQKEDKTESTPLPARERSTSLESTLYQLGSFKPFLSDDIFGNLLIDGATSRPKEPEQQTTNRGGPPVSLPKKLSKDQQATTLHSASKPAKSDPFSNTGLLGRTYSQRQKAMQDRFDVERLPQDHLLPGQRPLLDFTPQYREPVQHSSKGRGFVPDHTPSGGLVNMATGRDEAYSLIPNFPLPPSQSTGFPQRSGTVKSTRTTRGAKRTSDAPDVPSSAFTGGGLLATADEGVGAGRLGKGFASGNRAADGPLLDLREERRYVPGSLLDSVERWEDSEGVSRDRVVVDRSRRTEKDIKVGERL